MKLKSLWSGSQGTQGSKVDVSSSTVAFRELLQEYDVVEVVPNDGDPFVVVSDRTHPATADELEEKEWALRQGLPTFAEPRTVVSQPQMPVSLAETSVEVAELGTSSPSPFTSHFRKEYNQELVGLEGLQKYDRMRKSDGTVRGTLRLVKTPVLAARWFIEPANDSTYEQRKADFVWKCFTEYMSISWPQVLTEALLSADFGYYMFEKVWENRVIDGKLRTVWKKLAPRHPMDVKEWRYDANGGPASVVMYPPVSPYGYPYGSTSTVNGQPVPGPTYVGPLGVSSETEGIEIPIQKLLVFTFDREAGDIQGISVLRSAYKHWYYKEQLYKIDAIQKERHGIGIPVIKLPPGFNRDDKAAANELGRNLRTNERAHVVLPPNWELLFAKLEGQPVDALKSIDHHDGRIRENILAPFIGENVTTKEEDQALFLKATRFIADIVAETFNLYGIPELVGYNFARGGVPKLRARRIGEVEDQRTLSFTLRNMIGAKAVTPDDELEAFVRRELDLPLANPDTSREDRVDNSSKQQGPDKPGLPRQSQNPPVGTPAPTAGQDRRGR